MTTTACLPLDHEQQIALATAMLQFMRAAEKAGVPLTVGLIYFVREASEMWLRMASDTPALEG